MLFLLVVVMQDSILPTGPFRVGEHVAELFDTPFLADLTNGELPEKYLCDGIEG